MAFNIRQITVPMGTVTGNKDITIAGFGTPKAVICIASFSDSGLNTLTPQARKSVSFTDGIGSAGDGYVSNDAASTTTTRRDSNQGHVLRLLDTGGGKLIQADFVSWITDGIRINITDVNVTAQSYVTFIMINGDDLISAKVESKSLSGSTPVTVTTLGFEPTIVFTTCSGQGYGDLVSSYGIFSYGISINDGTDKNNGILWNDNSGVSTTNVDTYNTASFCAAQLTNEVLSWRAYFNNYTSTGFDINWVGASSNDAIHYLALELSPNVKLDLSLIDSPSTTGTFTESSIPFQPEFLMIASGGNASLNTLNGSNALNTFTTDGDESFSHSSSSQNAVTTSNAKTYLSNDLHFLGNGSSNVEVGTFTSFNSDGYSLNLTTATTKKWMRLLIGANATVSNLNESHPLYPNLIRSLKDGNKTAFLADQTGGTDHTATQSLHNVFTTANVSGVAPTQGIATDGTYWYQINTSAIYKKDFTTGALATSNTSPFTGLLSGVDHIGDGFVDNGLLYVPIVNWDSPTETATAQCIAVFNTSDLSLNKFYDISAQTNFNGSGLTKSHTGTIYGTSFAKASTPLARQQEIYEFNLDTGAYISTKLLSDYAIGAQGITWDGESYLISTWDTINNNNYIKQYDETLTYIDSIDPTGLDAPSAGVEIEGIEYFDGVWYVHALNTGLREFDKRSMYIHGTTGTAVQFLTQAQIPEEGTIVIRMTPHTFLDYRTVFDNKDTANDWESWIYATGELAWRVSSAGRTGNNYPDGANIEHIFMFSWKKNGGNVDLQLGVDGSIVSTVTTVWVAQPAQGLWLGGGNAGNTKADHTYSDVLVYNKELTAGEWTTLSGNLNSVYKQTLIPLQKDFSITAELLERVSKDFNTVTNFGDPVSNIIIRQITVPMGTVTGNKDITIAGLGTPKAFVCVGTFSSVGLDSEASHARMGIGYCDGLRSSGHNFVSGYNDNPSITSASEFDYRVMELLTTAGGLLIQVDFVSWITDGVRVNITGVNPVAQTYMTFMFITGDDVIDVDVGAFSAEASSPKLVNTVGFEPDLVLLSTVTQVTEPNNSFSYGYATKDGIKSKGLLLSDKNSVSPTVIKSYSADNDCVGQLVDSTVVWKGNVTNYNSTGFNFNWTGASNNAVIRYLALKFAPNVKVALDFIDAPSTGGQFIESGLGMTPKGVVISALGNTVLDTVESGAGLGVSFLGGNGEVASHATGMKDNSTPAWNSTYTTTSFVELRNNEFINHRGTFTGFTANGYELNLSVANPAKWLRLAIGESSTLSLTKDFQFLGDLLSKEIKSYTPDITLLTRDTSDYTPKMDLFERVNTDYTTDTNLFGKIDNDYQTLINMYGKEEVNFTLITELLNVIDKDYQMLSDLLSAEEVNFTLDTELLGRIQTNYQTLIAMYGKQATDYSSVFSMQERMVRDYQTVANFLSQNELTHSVEVELLARDEATYELVTDLLNQVATEYGILTHFNQQMITNYATLTDFLESTGKDYQMLMDLFTSNQVAVDFTVAIEFLQSAEKVYNLLTNLTQNASGPVNYSMVTEILEKVQLTHETTMDILEKVLVAKDLNVTLLQKETTNFDEVMTLMQQAQTPYNMVADFIQRVDKSFSIGLDILNSNETLTSFTIAMDLQSRIQKAFSTEIDLLNKRTKDHQIVATLFNAVTMVLVSEFNLTERTSSQYTLTMDYMASVGTSYDVVFSLEQFDGPSIPLHFIINVGGVIKFNDKVTELVVTERNDKIIII